MQIVNIPGENGTRIKPKYSHKSNNAPIILYLPYETTTEFDAVIDGIFDKAGFNILTMQISSSDHANDLINATCCWDWLRSMNPEAEQCWIIGTLTGAWIGMQILMRRPEFHRFISINPSSDIHDFSFLAPCPCSGLIINGYLFAKDIPSAIVPNPATIEKLVQKISMQSNIVISHHKLPMEHKDGISQDIRKTIADYINANLIKTSFLKKKNSK